VTLALALTLFALGLIGAFVSGLVGVGGAVLMIPLLLYIPPLLGTGALDIKDVAGITMAQILAAAAIGAWTHGKSAMLHHRLAVYGGTAMALGALGGAVGSRYVESRVLLALFAVMTSVALPLMFVPPAPGPRISATREPPFNRVAALAYPGAIGIASGLVGAGGAFLLVPVLIGVLRIPVRMSIGTSLAMTSMAACMGFLGKLVTGQIPLAAAAAVVLGSVSGASIGARLSHRAPVAVLRVVLAAIIALATVRVWADVLTGR
jgi:uncharacterized protein